MLIQRACIERSVLKKKHLIFREEKTSEQKKTGEVKRELKW